MIAHNHIHDAPHQAIEFLGNDHRIEYNEIHHVVTETDDAGAVNTGRDWTARGTLIRYNYVHDVGGYGKSTMGIYLDDQASGISIEGNVFFGMRYAAFIGGGRDNRVVNNVFVDCDPAVHLDARGQGWQSNASNDPHGPFRKALASVPYDREPYITRYPELADVLESPGTPRRNLIAGNLFYGGRWDDIASGVKDLQVVKDNWVAGDPGFAEPSRLRGSPKATDFALSPGAAGFKAGFRPIPLHRIGPVPDPSADPP